MTKQKLAIVIPSLNSDSLYTLLDSIWDTNKALWKGDYPDLVGDLIVVQDVPSQDRVNYFNRTFQMTYNIYRNFGGSAIVLVNQERVGMQKAFNIGIKWALEHSADYIAIMNDDIVFQSDDTLYKLFKIIKENPEYGYVAPVVQRDQGYIPNYFASIGECSIHTRQSIEKVGLFNENPVFNKLGIDIEYNYRILQNYKPHGVSDIMVKHPEPGQTTRTNNPITQNDIIELDNYLLKNFGKDSRAVDEHRIPAYISMNKPIKEAEFTDIKSNSESKNMEKQFSHMTKLNIGSFTVMSHDWENWDIIDLSRYASDNGFNFKQVDIRNRLPKDDNSVDIINCSHTIEHINRDEGKQFLQESFRILKPNGIIRLTVPDAEIITKDYLSKAISRHSSHNEGVKNATDNAQSLYELLIAGHQTIYDFDSLKKLLQDTGFGFVKKQEYEKSYSKELKIHSANMFPELSLYIEGVKSFWREDGTTGMVINTQSHITEQIIIKEGLPESIQTTSNITNNDNKKLRIALISTPFFGVPPKQYGGLEALVWDLAEGLDKLGHIVTLFAPEGSKKPEHGNLITTGPALDTVNVDWKQSEKNNYEIYKQYITSDKFEIVDGHDWFGYEFLLKMNDPKLKVTHQHHGGLNWSCPPPNIPKMNLVALSQFMQNYSIQYFKQKGYNIDCKYSYNGIDLDYYKYDTSIKRTNRLLYVGRYSKFKGAHDAIALSRRVNIPIDLIGAAKFIDDPNYLKEIESMCDTVVSNEQLESGVYYDYKGITMFKDVSNEFKLRKMQEAKCLIFPSRMNEPFGLGIIQAMATGSPVIAYDDGAIKEIITPETGFVCNNLDEMVNAISKIDTIKSEDCRKRAEFFSKENMAKNKEKLYREIIAENQW